MSVDDDELNKRINCLREIITETNLEIERLQLETKRLNYMIEQLTGDDSNNELSVIKARIPPR